MHKISRTLIHAIVLASLLLQLSPPAQAMAPAAVGTPAVGTPASSPLAAEEASPIPGTHPDRQISQQTASPAAKEPKQSALSGLAQAGRLQAVRPEPTPVPLGEPLPPGTIPHQEQGPSNPLYSVYLPLVQWDYTPPLPEVALAPEVWRESTTDWGVFELGKLAGRGVVTVRYPPTWEKHAALTAEDAGGLHVAGEGESIHVLMERAPNVSAQAHQQMPSFIARYEGLGHPVRAVRVKGLAAWEAAPAASVDGVCQEMAVAMPGAWARFQLASDAERQQCPSRQVWDLVVSSLQIRVDNHEPAADVEAQAARAPRSATLIDYNRSAAYNYAATWGPVADNDDNYYYYLSDGTPVDGAHFLAHVMQAGGFPIHWNAGQGHGDPIVANINSQRSYVQGTGEVSVVSAGSMDVGDIIYMNSDSGWCWGLAVVRMDGSTPYVSTHSDELFNIRYDLCYCNSPNYWYEFNHINDSPPPANPQINSGLDLNPSTQQVNDNVTASFNVHNYGGQGVNLQLRVTSNGGGEWAETSCGLPAGGDCSYNQTRSFGSGGSYNACAQMNYGSGWQNIPANGGVTCRTLNIVSPADVRLSSGLSLTPNELGHAGGAVRASFGAQNYGGTATTERFRARVTSGPVSFDETGDVSLSGGQSYTYDNSKTFSQIGLYEVIAEHYEGGSWKALIGNGSGFVRVKAPPPSPPEQNKGDPPAGGNAGEPVNTSTGNYFYDSTDMSDPTPGLSLAATRWYNSLDAGEGMGPFGYGAAWTYNMTVTWRVDKSAIVRMADGHAAYFLGEIDPLHPTDLTGTYLGQGRDTGASMELAADGTAVLTTPGQASYHFDAAGRLTHLTRQPDRIDVIYSGDLPVQLLHSAGVTHTLTYNGLLITGISSSSGQSVTYTYTLSDDLASVTRPDGSTYTYLYDENHRLTEARDPNGHAYVRNVYDEQGRVILQYDQTGQESVFSYDAGTTGSSVFTDTLGQVITHTYDADYRLLTTVDELGYTTIYTRDAAGNVLARQDKDGAVWHYTYDERGNQLSETDPLGNIWTYTYDAHNNRTSQTDPVGRTWRYEYDAQDRLLRTIDPLSHTREYTYDSLGKLVEERDETGAATRYEYNELGWQTAISTSLGQVTRMQYDAVGNQTVYTDANGGVASFVHDGLNQLVESVDPLGTVITLTYDAMGNLMAKSDGMGRLKRYRYDAHDRVISETDWNGNPTYYGYDALGRQAIVTDALGYTTIMTYNAVGNLVAQRGKDGAVTRYDYDSMRRLIRETDALSRTTEYVYDAAGRQVQVRRPCDGCTGGVAVWGMAYNAAGQIVQETDPRGAITQYGYDAVGRLAIITDTHGHTLTTSYDAAGRVIQETDELGAITRYAYNTQGQLVTTTNALGYQSINSYDQVGNLVQTVNERGYTTTQVYNANGQVEAHTDALGNTYRNVYDAQGRLLTTTDPLSRTTTYTYDANGNRLTETDPRGHTTTYAYDAFNRLVEVIDPASCCGAGSRHITYDAAGRVIAETNALGHTRVYTYDVAGRKVAESSPLGHTTVYTYDVADNLVARQDPASSPQIGEAGGEAIWRFAYDAKGSQVRQVDPLGNVYQTEYDLLGRTVKETDPLGATTRSQYDAAGRLIARTDPRGATYQYAYDLLGQVIQETGPLGYTRIYTYDAAGNQVAGQDERGFVTLAVYDGLNRQVAQIDPLGQTRITTYDAAGKMTAEIDYSGNAARYAYDEAGNPITITNALSDTTTTVYDALNRPIAVTDGLGHTRRTGYDALGQVISETTPLGHTSVYTYNAEGWQAARSDALGQAWTNEYDVAGRLVRETDPLGHSKATTYDLLGRVIARTDALGRITTYTYDPLGRLLAVTGPGGEVSQRYTYDPAGNVLTEQDGNGHVTRYEYDRAGRQVSKTDPLGASWRYAYDEAGNQTSLSTPAGHLIIQTYDALGRLVNKTYDGEQQVAYVYDANGNRTVVTDTMGVSVYTYDPLNRLVASIDPAGRAVTHTYNLAGQRVSLAYPDGATARYAYDADGNLDQVTAPGGGVTSYERDALGRPVHVREANGVVVETAYDAVGNTLSIKQQDAQGRVFAQLGYTVDAAERRTQAIEDLPQGRIVTSYAYDDLDRLVESVASDGRETGYAFDKAGNRTAMWGTRLQDGVIESYHIAYAYNAANQLLKIVDSGKGETRYTYDADGNRTGSYAFADRASYAYDAEGHLVQAQVEALSGGEWIYKDGTYERYAYDSGGRRVRKDTVSAASDSLVTRREYRYDDASGWDVLQSYDIAAEVTESRFLYDQSLHKLAYWREGDAGYLQNDALGSVLGATDASGSLAAPDGLMRYGDYGEELGPDSALLTGDSFTGYERDAYTGLNYARNRYYDPAAGVFITPDPFPAKKQDLLDLHRYLYVQASPTNWVDSLGLFKWTTASSGIIEYGDTLWGIAASYWGVSPYQVNWDMIYAIQQFNAWIQNPNLIYAGYTLRLPTPLSAYQHLAFANQSATSNGTDGSDCGQNTPGGGGTGGTGNPGGAGGTGNPGGTGGTGNPGGTVDPGNPGGTGGTGNPGGTDSGNITVIDNTKTSPAWKFFASLSKLSFKKSSQKYSISIPKEGWIKAYVPPIPPIGFTGGTFEFKFSAEIYAKVYWDGSKALQQSPCATGWCAVAGASAELEARIPLWGPIYFGAWGKIDGEIGACLVGQWQNNNTLRLYLEPEGYIQGQIGAKIYLYLGGSVLGAKIEGEAGVKGSLNAKADLNQVKLWAEAGPYVEATAEFKIFGKEVEASYEWEKQLPLGEKVYTYAEIFGN